MFRELLLLLAMLHIVMSIDGTIKESKPVIVTCGKICISK